jgi:hypothetical protein
LRIMRGTQGAFIVASILQIIMGFSGLWRIVVRFVFSHACPSALSFQLRTVDELISNVSSLISYVH